ncbi:hypothetical protein DL768_010697 [Monosporascus sp. mg162]|nr:hypothetical protein DL768_010697 [Monosporascus sp. mg162]
MPRQTRHYTCGLWVAYVFFIICRDPAKWGNNIMTDGSGLGEYRMQNKITDMIRGFLGLKPEEEDAERNAGEWPGNPPSPLAEDDDDEPDSDQSARLFQSRRRQRKLRPDQATQPDLTPSKLPFEMKYKLRPAVGDQRAMAMVQGQYVTPYKWVGDTFEDAGQRPEPYFPQGWPGWGRYKAMISTEKPEDKAQKEQERAKQREDLARRRGRSPELRMLEDKPRKR